MANWTDWLFGSQPPPARPTSRGAMLGARYQAMPEGMVEDRRHDAPDYAYQMRHPFTKYDQYSPYTASIEIDPYAFQGGYDPLVASPLIATRGLRRNTPGDYAPSFQQNLRPPRQPSFPRNLPSPSSDSDLPYIGAHLPWSPSDPGWAPPPQFSPLNSNDAVRFWRGDA